MGQQGVTMQQIAEHYGVSRQRVKQILDKKIPRWYQNYGKFIRDQQKQEEAEKLNEAYLKKWGPNRGLINKDLYSVQRFKFGRKKANATQIGFTWTLEFTDLEWPTHCPILGIELDYFAPYAQENSPSFDRINSNLGYIKGNVQVVSWRANRIKNNGTWEEHIKIGEYMKNLEQGSCGS